MRKQPLETDPRLDHILVAVLNRMVVLEHIALVLVNLAQMIDQAIARDRRQPRQEWPRGIVGSALGLKCQPYGLPQVFQLVRGHPPPAIPSETHAPYGQHPSVGGLSAIPCR